MLYEDFAKSQAKREVEDCLDDQEKGGRKEEATQPTTHIFQVSVCGSHKHLMHSHIPSPLPFPSLLLPPCVCVCLCVCGGEVGVKHL